MTRWITAGATITIMLSILTGCWDTKPIDKRLLPVVMAVELSEDRNYTVSLRLADPSKEQVTQTISAEAPTISEAFDRMRRDEERSIDLLHLTLILIGENLGKAGIKGVIDYAMRTREIDPKALLAIVKGDIHRLMRSKENIKLEDGTELLDFFNKRAGWTPNIPVTNIWEAFRDLNSETGDMALPIIKEGTDTMFEFVSTAVMSEDRMTGTITTDDTFLYNLFQREFTGGIVEVTDRASLQIVDADVKHHASWDGIHSRLDTKMKIGAVILELKGQFNRDELKSELENMLEQRFNRMFEKLQKGRSDILRTGQLFRSKIPPDQMVFWIERWYPKLNIELQVDVVIRNHGNLKM
ncbi:Ger(x)C family spore germination protein [Paenibacillus tarimensis]